MKTLLLILLILNFSAQCKEDTFSEIKQFAITGFEIVQNKIPLFVGNSENVLFEVKLTNNNSEPVALQKITLHFADKSNLTVVSNLTAIVLTSENALFGFINFGKMKTAYPQLTPGDLRLCAYLRMNLSSKEIAPLLGISFRGV